jgi:hypothetical protein
MDRVRTELVERFPGLDLGRDVAPAALQPLPRFRLADGRVSALGQSLLPVAHRTVSLPADARLLAAAPDLSAIIGADGEQLVMLTDKEHRYGLPGADSATFLPSGRLIVTAAVMEHTTWRGQLRSYRGAHRVLLIDPAAGEPLDEGMLDVSDAGVMAIPHPSDGTAVLDAGEGQDGSQVFAVTAAHDKLAIRPLAENVVVGGFDPGGSRLLLTPHPSYPSEVSVVTWPELHSVRTVTAGDAGVGNDDFDLYGFFLDEKNVLLKTVEGRMALFNRDLQFTATVNLAGELPDASVIETVMGTGPGLFAAEVWQGDSRSAFVWRLVPLQPAPAGFG